MLNEYARVVRRRVAHIVPGMNIGGVEVAIARSFSEFNEPWDYRVFYVREKGRIRIGQRHVLSLICSTILRRWIPEVVISSLWWAHPVGWFLSLFGVSWVAFFHSSSFAHRLDKASLTWAWRRADFCLVDSSATGTYMRRIAERQSDVVPYLFFDAVLGQPWCQRSVDLIWVGRDVESKRFDLYLALLMKLAAKLPSVRAKAVLAGRDWKNPDVELPSNLRLEVVLNAPHDAVLSHLSGSRFYVLTSDFEGFSMSTVEAVQAGCVPVVRLVGGVSEYLSFNSAIVISDADVNSVIDTIVRTWNDPERASIILKEASRGIEKFPSYATAMRRAIEKSGG